MSELEPTSTKLEPTANERLRRLLDECGVEWWCGEDERKTYWRSNDLTWEYFNDENGDAWLGFLGACESDVTPAQAIDATLGPTITGETSDGYHTFNELYHHRAVLFSVIVRDHADLAWKSRLHHDGTMYDGMFIVGIETPDGQATYHYDLNPYWDMFECKELDRAPEWDGHTPDDAIARIATLGRGTCKNTAPSYLDFLCSECGFVYYRNDENYSGGNDWHFCPNCGRHCIG